MRGGYLHNHILLDPIETMLRRAGAQTHREFPVHHTTLRGAIDLAACFDGVLVAIEAELTPDRVVRDVQKARAAGAVLLVIVVPTPIVAAAATRRLQRNSLYAGPNLPIWILPLGPALQRLRRCFPLFSTLIPGTERKPSTGD